MIAIKDQIGTVLKFEKLPERIVCLVPSISKLLIDLGVSENLVGITKFCDQPHNYAIEKIGGTKNPTINKIKSLKPDLIIANKEENNKSDIELLAEICSCYVSDIKNLEDNYQMIRDLSALCNKLKEGETIIEKINSGFLEVKGENQLNACYLIWKDPYMTIGKDTFIHFIMNYCGIENVYNQYSRYPTIDVADIKSKNPEVILLSSEPFPFKEKHRLELQKYLPEAKILLVDGRDFSWYGSHMISASKNLKELITNFK
jgi:ABC-type Fe3+-hydroxamate transport system substrate-binding protein